MATGKEIRFGVEGRAAMLKGVDLLADAVQVSSLFELLHDVICYEIMCVYIYSAEVMAESTSNVMNGASYNLPNSYLKSSSKYLSQLSHHFT